MNSHQYRKARRKHLAERKSQLKGEKYDIYYHSAGSASVMVSPNTPDYKNKIVYLDFEKTLDYITYDCYDLPESKTLNTIPHRINSNLTTLSKKNVLFRDIENSLVDKSNSHIEAEVYATNIKKLVEERKQIPAFHIAKHVDSSNEDNKHCKKMQRLKGTHSYTVSVNVPYFNTEVITYFTDLFIEKGEHIFDEFTAVIDLSTDMFKVVKYPLVDHITKYLSLDFFSVYIESVAQSPDFYRTEPMFDYDKFFPEN